MTNRERMQTVEAKNLISEITDKHSYSLVIGNFDGVHVGHRDLLSRVREESEKKGLKMIVVTFTPHPIKIIKGSDSFLLNTYEERRTLLEAQGVDLLLEIPFSRDLSTRPPEYFLDEYIFKIPNLDTLYLGYDFAFGSNKSGDHRFVEEYCKDKFNVQVQPEFRLKGEDVSSSKIRKLLLDGKVERAGLFLGREYFISGRVIKGKGRGRQIGIPTANIEFDSDLIVPRGGVYITKTRYKDQIYYSVTNIGKNPTFLDNAIVSVETHLLDFDNDIYGDEISVSFLKRLREEKKFGSVNELVDQIRADIDSAKKYFET